MLAFRPYAKERGLLSPEALCCVQATNMMFVASLMMAIAVEHSGAHRRLSLHLITALGTGTSRIMLGRQSRDCRICAKYCKSHVSGFMLVTMFLSMWISNTAAMALMVPIVDSICEAMFEAGEDTAGGEARARTPAQERLRNMMLLACAYSANIGGTGVQYDTAQSTVQQ